MFSVKYLISFLKKNLLLGLFEDKLGFGECPLCKNVSTDVIAIPCGHFSHCHECELKKTTIKEARCSVCKREYKRSIKIYL